MTFKTNFKYHCSTFPRLQYARILIPDSRIVFWVRNSNLSLNSQLLFSFRQLFLQLFNFDIFFNHQLLPSLVTLLQSISSMFYARVFRTKFWRQKISNPKHSFVSCEEGLISNTGISRTGSSKTFLSRKLERRVSQKFSTAFSKLISKTGISKMLLGTNRSIDVYVPNIGSGL